MTATPGQAAYEAWAGTAADWNGRLNTFQQAGWETIGQAAVDAFLAGDSVSAESIREALAAQEPQPTPGVWTVSECLERVGVLAAALHEIKTAYTPGTYAHDLAHATLDQSGPAPKPAPELAAATVLAEVLDFLGNGIPPGDEFAHQVAQWRKRGLPA